jgi:hypothetical protein
MTISLKIRTKKVSEDDITLNLPEQPDEAATWVWRMKGLRAEDIMDVDMLDKTLTVITIWDYKQDAPKRLLVKEPFDAVMLKWELALSQPILFEEEEEDDNDLPDEGED